MMGTVARYKAAVLLFFCLVGIVLAFAKYVRARMCLAYSKYVVCLCESIDAPCSEKRIVRKSLAVSQKNSIFAQ